MATLDRSARVTLFQALCRKADDLAALRATDELKVESPLAWTLLLAHRLEAIETDILAGEFPNDQILALAADAFAWLEKLATEAAA